MLFRSDDFEAANAEKSNGNVDSQHKWSYEWHDIPDPADRGVLIRQTLASNDLSGNAHAYSVGLGNQYDHHVSHPSSPLTLSHRFVSEYYIEGHQFVHENVVVFLHRILHEPGVRSLETTPKEHLPPFSHLHPLDPSGAYILEAKIRVQDLNNPTLVDLGVEELKAFQTQ